MADELVFYTNPMSRGRIVRWMLEEVGQPYRTEVLDYGTTMKAPDYLAVNPMGKVPAIKHGDTVVTEARRDLRLSGRRLSEAGLAPPPGDQRRGPYYRWLFFARGPARGRGDQQGAGRRACRRSASAWWAMARFERCHRRARGRRVREATILAGESFTAADVYLGAQIGWGMQFGTIEKRPAFERYWQRLAKRPAAISANEIDDKLVAEMKKAKSS